MTRKRKRPERTIDRVKKSASKDRDGLTPRQEVFALQYVIDLNGKDAAIRAGYSPRSAEVTAARMLSNAKVLARIRQLQKRTEEKLNVSRERVVLEAQRLAFSDVRDLLKQEKGKSPEFRSLKDIPDHAAAAIRKFKLHRDGTWELELYPKVPSVELLAKLMGYTSGPEEGRKGAIEIPNDARVIVIGGSETEFVLACRRARGEE